MVCKEHNLSRLLKKSARVAGCVNDFVSRNKYMRKETQYKIYKVTVHPIMAYALETRAET